MKDRTPTYPGRVRLTPVAGQENVFDLQMADQPVEEGTPINKATLLTDETAAALGLDPAEDPTVDEAIAAITRTALDCGYWMRRAMTYTEEATSPSSSYLVSIGASSSDIITIYYVDELTTTSDGSVVMEDPQSVEISYNNRSAASVLSGKYWTPLTNVRVQQTAIYYTPSDKSVGVEYYSSYGYYIYSSGSQTVKFNPEYGPWELVEYTEDSTKYTPGLHDGYLYTYETKPLWSGKVAIGSYVGTGVYGLANQNQLSFDFTPVIVIIYREDSQTMVPLFYLWGQNFYQTISGSSTGQVCITGKRVEWYSDTASRQLNYSGATYRYIAFG